MSSSALPALQQLRRLDRSSPDFADRLNGILHGKEYAQCEPNLGNDLEWLIEYLDEVRYRVEFSRPPAQVGTGA